MSESDIQTLLSLSGDDLQRARKEYFERFAARTLGAAIGVANLFDFGDPMTETLVAAAIPFAGSASPDGSDMVDTQKVAFEISRSNVSQESSERAKLVAMGIVGERPAEVKYALREFSPVGWRTGAAPSEALEQSFWDSFLLLARRMQMADLGKSAGIVETAREHVGKDQWEGGEFDEPDAHAALSEAAWCYGLRACEIVANYASGLPVTIAGRSASSRGVRNEVSRLMNRAAQLARLAGTEPRKRHVLNLIHQALLVIVSSSVFAMRLPDSLNQMRRDLATRPSKALLEFWPGQIQALQKSLLDPTKVGVVVSMPTSAGKTLLAEMAIEQALSERVGSRVVYLAPTRALVNQIANTLRHDLHRIIRIASPVYELDSVENIILSNELDILVTTPEKLDLLFRSNHPSVDDLSLVVVDEAHNLADSKRGSRLEMLITSIRNEREDCRILMLTPFAKNAKSVAQWLDESNSVDIMVEWTPTTRVVATARARTLGRGQGTALELCTADTPQSKCPPDVVVKLGRYSRDDLSSKSKMVQKIVRRWQGDDKQGILVLCETVKKSMERARQISAERVIRESSYLVDLVCDYLDAEVDGEHPLSLHLRRGVAFHHAGLSPEARFLVERLVAEGEVQIVCATTTLAQGMHFPLSLAVIESHYHPKGISSREQIAPSAFWNIAGRVGRTMNDEMGLITFVATNLQQESTIRKYVAQDTGNIVSSLEEAFRELENEDVEFTTTMLRRFPALSGLMQFIVHAVATLGPEAARQRLDGLLRGSFVVHQLADSDSKMADQILNWSQRYLDELLDKKRKVIEWWAKAADSTGLSSPSADLIFAALNHEADGKKWDPDNLLRPPGQDNDVLRQAIEVMAQVPEIRLGTYFGGSFDPERVARIVQHWVAGTPLKRIADLEYHGDVLTCTKHINSAVTNLVPWGLRAIQRMLFARQSDVDWQALDRSPAMIFHGVRSQEAIALRMLNVPRFAAEGLARRLREEQVDLQEAEGWVNGLDDGGWSVGIPSGAALSGRHLRTVWRMMEGRE